MINISPLSDKPTQQQLRKPREMHELVTDENPVKLRQIFSPPICTEVIKTPNARHDKAIHQAC